MLYDQYSLRIKAHISISTEHLNNCKILDFAVSEQEKQVESETKLLGGSMFG